MMVNASGAHVLLEAPGLTRSAWGDGSARFWASPPELEDYVVEVRDRRSRFLPLRFDAMLPQKGFFVPLCPQSALTSPLEADADPGVAGGFITLYSHPARTAPAGAACVRASLKRLDETPAAWALLAAYSHGRRVAVGLADAVGDVALVFPFPELDRRPFTSGSPIEAPPPQQGAGALPILGVDLAFRAYWGDLDREAIPDHCAILSQPERTCLGALSPRTPLAARRLVKGEELRLASGGCASLYLD
jgi:hypothetical protein